MTSIVQAQAGTALSPEWDRGFDEAFTDLVAADPDWVREEFDALIGANFNEPPEPPSPPAPPAGQPASPPSSAENSTTTPHEETDQIPADPNAIQRSPP